MKQLLKAVWVAASLCAAGLCFASAPAVFGGLNINSADDVLFTVSKDYQSLYLSHLGATKAAGTPKLLSCYPAQLLALNGGKTLYIRNNEGSACYESSSATKPQSLIWTGAGGEPYPAAASPDGKWLCFAERVQSASGRLVLREVRSGRDFVLAEKLPFTPELIPAKWSPDSKFLLYEKDGVVYFANPEYIIKNDGFPEEYRKIGGGSIASVQWTRAKSIVYIDGDVIYRIQEHELYIRGLYSYFIGNGSVVGRLLYPFNPATDAFWCNEKGTQLVINTADKFVSSCVIEEDAYDFVKPLIQLPLNKVAGIPLGCRVFWPYGSAPLLWVDYLPYNSGNNEKASDVYVLSGTVPLLLSVKASVAPALSPDGRYLALSDAESFSVYRLDDWKCVASLSGEKTLSVAWAAAKSLYVGGEQTVRFLEFADSQASPAQKATVLFLSSVSATGWNAGRILARTSDASPVYIYDATQNCWSLYERGTLDSPRQASKNFRVFLGESENSNYANAIFVRPLGKEAYTYLLSEETSRAAPALQKRALCFDLLDTAEGLAPVLAALQKHNVSATFFINGEFMRRYPKETKLLASSGHICASLFSATVDLLSRDYRLDKEFIQRGLARNEDEFYTLTGKELSLLWHTPYGNSNSYIVAAGKGSGYTYIDEGLAISFTIGKSGENIDAVISSLLESGCEIVPVQDLLAR